MQPSICVMISQAPYGAVHPAEGVRHVNGAIANGFDGVAVFVDDGVWALHRDQTAGTTGFTSLSGALGAALGNPAGPAPRVFVHRESLEARGLPMEDLIAGIEPVDDARLAQIVAGTQFLLRY